MLKQQFNFYLFVCFHPLLIFCIRHWSTDNRLMMENLTLDIIECDPLDSPSRRVLFFYFLLAVIVAAIPANAFSLYVSWQHIKQKNDLGVYLFELAVNDLIFAVGLLLRLDFLWRGFWAHGGYLCLISVYCLFTNFYTSEALLCCIAINRYLAVVYPFKYTYLRRVRTAAAVSVSMWGLVICFNATTITWENSYYETKTLSLCFDSVFLLAQKAVQVNIIRFFLGFIVPVVIVFYFTWGTCLAVKANQATKAEERVRISKLLTVVLFCILSCFGPPHVMMLLSTQFYNCNNSKWLLFGWKISNALSSLNCLIDPLLYCFITRTGQENVKHVVVLLLGEKKGNDANVEYNV